MCYFFETFKRHLNDTTIECPKNKCYFLGHSNDTTECQNNMFVFAVLISFFAEEKTKAVAAWESNPGSLVIATSALPLSYIYTTCNHLVSLLSCDLRVIDNPIPMALLKVSAGVIKAQNTNSENRMSSHDFIIYIYVDRHERNFKRCSLLIHNPVIDL